MTLHFAFLSNETGIIFQKQPFFTWTEQDLLCLHAAAAAYRHVKICTKLDICTLPRYTSLYLKFDECADWVGPDAAPL